MAVFTKGPSTESSAEKGKWAEVNLKRSTCQEKEGFLDAKCSIQGCQSVIINMLREQMPVKRRVRKQCTVKAVMREQRHVLP